MTYTGTRDSNNNKEKLDAAKFWEKYQMAAKGHSPDIQCQDYEITGNVFFINPSELEVYKHFPAIAFVNCDFSIPVKFMNNKDCNTYFYFQDCIFFAPVTFLNNEFANEINFHQGNFEQKLLISKCVFERLTFSASANRMEIFETNFSLLSIKNSALGQHSSIKDLFIDFRNVKGLLDISQISIHKLTLTNTINKEAEALIRDITIGELIGDSLFNLGRLNLYNLKPLHPSETAIVFKNSNLGKAEFVNLSLNEFTDVAFTASSIIECSFVNVTWGDLERKIKKAKDTAELHDFRESYRQFKHSYSKQGDSINEGKFHEYEMRAYFLYLCRGFIKSSLRKKRKNISMLLILGLSQITSNYGLSIIRPILTVLLICGGLFGLAVKYGDAIQLLPVLDFSKDTILDTAAKFSYFLYPLRKIDIHEVRPELILDLFSRIVVSYSIYNFIRATRRFVK